MSLARFCCIMAIGLLSSFAYGAVPEVTNINPGAGPAGTQVQITGTGFGRTQGASTVTFSGRKAAVLSWSDTEITAQVPSSAVSGAVVVTVAGTSSNKNISFNVAAPRISAIRPGGGVNSSIYPTPISQRDVVCWSDPQILAAAEKGSIAF